jgi:hypothetical protein
MQFADEVDIVNVEYLPDEQVAQLAAPVEAA